MAGWFPGGDSDYIRYKDSARRYCPDISVHFLDGKNQDVVSCCWASADIFLSLVDNPQETFGLSPVEAMAAEKDVNDEQDDGYAGKPAKNLLSQATSVESVDGSEAVLSSGCA